jgi:hypothetical protein
MKPEAVGAFAVAAIERGELRRGITVTGNYGDSLLRGDYAGFAVTGITVRVYSTAIRRVRGARERPERRSERALIAPV